MVELIDKKALLTNELGDVDCICENGEFYLSVEGLKKFIYNLPTTTEAEIRASVIDEFAEKLKESLVKNYRHFITTDTDGFEWLTTDAVTTHIEKVAEQLKEE